MNKLMKILIIINGLLLPIILIAGIYQISKPLFKQSEKYEERGLIVGEEAATKDSLALQGLYYDSPKSIHNSMNNYLPISVKTYEEAKSFKIAASSAGDMGYAFQQIVNIIFLDSSYQVIGKLLNKKASISDINIHYQTYNEKKRNFNYKYLAFQIAFEDSNHDGLLNYQDHHDLYISDLNGQNLTQVTEGIDIERFWFNELHTKIDIEYKERDGQREEYRRVEFAYYDIQRKQFIPHENLNNTLDEMEKALMNVP